MSTPDLLGGHQPGGHALMAAGGHEVATELLAVLAREHQALTGWPVRERVMAATWLASYRSARTRRAYAADLATWLDWLATRQVDVLAARRVHVDLWTRGLLDAGAASSSVARRLSAVSSWYRHLGEHDLIGVNPAAAVRRPRVDPDHTTTVGLDRDQARALLAAADADTGPARLRAAAAIRLLLHQGLRVDELSRADVADLGNDRGHRILTVTRKGGHRVALVLPPATGAALDTYLATRVATVATATNRVAGRPPVASANTAGTVTGPLLATSTGGRMDQAAFWHLVRRLARAAGIEHWAALSPHSLRHTAITLALDAGASLRDVQDFAGHRDPRTTRRYDRSRHSLDRNAAYTLAAYLA
jgi:integrase/recombinase XerD